MPFTSKPTNSGLTDVSVNLIYNVLNETFSQVIFFYELLKNNNVYSSYLSLSTHFLMMDYYYNYKIQLDENSKGGIWKCTPC